MYRFNKLKAIVLIALLVFPLAAPGLPRASAASTAGFQAGRIIDDPVFFDKNSMNASQIQAFLNSQVPVCQRWHAQGGYSQAPPYTCLKEYQENTTTLENNYGRFTGEAPYNVPGGKSAAEIIYDVSQQYGISPKVMLVLLEKEQILVRDSWPLYTQFKKATGYACPDTAPCDTKYYGFYNQVSSAAWQFTRYAASSGSFNFRAKATRFVGYNPSASCGGTDVYIQNQATANLYNYTPYQPNAGALAAGYGTAPCGAYGNRNFYLFFNDWFGSTYAFVQNGIDYNAVFDPTYYLGNNPDINAVFNGNQYTAFNHFVTDGMREGRIATANFNVTSYRNRYPDLRWAFGKNLPAYYWHYIVAGKGENRTATGSIELQPVTNYGGIDYSPIYNFSAYVASNQDILNTYANDDTGALWHFVTNGMREGRTASDDFSLVSYMSRYPDLRAVFKDNIRLYYLHYLSIGKAEGRISTGDYLGGTSVAGGVDYSPIYNFDYYEKSNPDIKKTFGLNDAAVLQHFISTGMTEGRQGSSTFNVAAYKAQNIDLQQAFGNNLKQYYIHFLTTGQSEGRSGV